MKVLNLRFLFIAGIGMLACAASFAQESARTALASEKYIISAKAGGINHVEGSVSSIRATGTGGLLLRGDRLDIGDRITTGPDGRAEVLLNPGSYLRLGSNSEFEFRTTTLDDLQVSLNRGSAIFEVFAGEDFTVSVFTPSGRASINESGVYRVDVNADGSGTLAVVEGKAEVGNALEVKEGRFAAISADTATVAKFDRGERDELAQWSKTRAKDLAKMTSSLKNRNVRDVLANSFVNRRWNMLDSFGLWVYNPFARSYCFLPFGYGWNSPYGYGFGNGIYWYNLPHVAYYPANVATAPGTKPPRAGRIRSIEPPFARIEKERAPVRSIRGWDFPGDASSPIRTSRAPAPVYLPAPPANGSKPRKN